MKDIVVRLHSRYWIFHQICRIFSHYHRIGWMLIWPLSFDLLSVWNYQYSTRPHNHPYFDKEKCENEIICFSITKIHVLMILCNWTEYLNDLIIFDFITSAKYQEFQYYKSNGKLKGHWWRVSYLTTLIINCVIIFKWYNTI